LEELEKYKDLTHFLFFSAFSLSLSLAFFQVNNRVRNLFSSDGTMYNLEKIQEIAFTSDNDEDGLPLLSIGMFESVAAAKGTKDTRKKLIHFTDTQHRVAPPEKLEEEGEEAGEGGGEGESAAEAVVGEEDNSGSEEEEEDHDVQFGVHIRTNSLEMVSRWTCVGTFKHFTF